MSYFRFSRASRAGTNTRLVCVVLWLMLRPQFQCTEYIRANQSLTRVPYDIPYDVTRVSLGYNLIDRVDYINGNWTNIEDLNLESNVMVEFPDLRNCSLVKRLVVKSNLIENIPPERLDILTHLEYIDMRYNKLAHFPDVSGPSLTIIKIDISANLFTEVPELPLLGGNLKQFHIWSNSLGNISEDSWVWYPVIVTIGISNLGLTAFPRLGSMEKTLTELKLQRNAIIEIPNDFLARFPRLEYLDLSANAISRLPGSICQRSSLMPPLQLLVKDNPLQCDKGLGWLMAPEAAGTIHVEDSPICAGPGDLTGKMWSDLTWGDLQQQAPLVSGKQGIADIIPVDYDCDVMAVTRVTRASSAPHCAVQCLADGACVMFGYEATGGGPQNCAITRPTDTAAIADRNLFQRWYMFK